MPSQRFEHNSMDKFSEMILSLVKEDQTDRNSESAVPIN